MLQEVDAAPTKLMTNKEEVIRLVIDEIRPNLRRDGGDCELIEICGNKVMVRLTGACMFCKLSSATLEGIQAKIVERLGEFVRLVPVAGAPRTELSGAGVTRVYLDNNATTRVDSRVVEKMLPYFADAFGNASSTHLFGEEVSTAVREARRSVQALVGAAHDHEIVFTSGGTESDNAAILAGLAATEGRDEIVTSAVEHPAILSLIEHLRDKQGVKVHVIGVDEHGRLDIDAYRAALGPKTAIVSMMWANNETGTLFPVASLAEIAHEAGALFHTDAVQAVGKTPIDVKSTKIDFLSLSAHKLHGPKGVGALYVRKGTKFSPLIRGGHQERTRRGGTENTPGIVGLGMAAEIARVGLDEEAVQIGALRDRLESRILKEIGHCRVSGDLESRLPNTANIAFFDIEGEAVLTNLNRAGIAASTGSACTAGSNEPSHVLKAMNVPAQALQGAVRFSLSRDNSEADVDRVMEVLPGVVAKLREMAQTVTETQPALT